MIRLFIISSWLNASLKSIAAYAKPANPWSASAPEQVAVATLTKNGSVTSRAIGLVAGAAKKYVNVDIGGVNPSKLGDTTKQSFEKASDSMKQANGSN